MIKENILRKQEINLYSSSLIGNSARLSVMVKMVLKIIKGHTLAL